MKSSHQLNAQRERWAEDLPSRPQMPQKMPEEESSQTPEPKKTVSLVASSILTETENRRVNMDKASSRKQLPCIDPVQNAALSSRPLNAGPPPRQKSIDDVLDQLAQLREQRAETDVSRNDIAGRNRPYEQRYAFTDAKSSSDPKHEQGIERIGIHFQCYNFKGPRADRSLALSRQLRDKAKATMNSQRIDHRQIDHQAYRDFMKAPKILTWCSRCRGLWANCLLCGMRKHSGLPPEEPPPAEQIIRENASLYRRLFSIPDRNTKAEAKRNKQPTASAKPRPGTKQVQQKPEWDIEAVDEPVFTSWAPDATTTDPVAIWNEFDAQRGYGVSATRDPTTPTKPIVAPTRPIDKQEPAQTKKPQNQPRSLQSRDQKDQAITITAKRNVRPPARAATTVQLQEPKHTGCLCFRCWEYGHISRNCPNPLAHTVPDQERLRVLKGRPLTLIWRGVLEKNKILPMTLEEARRTGNTLTRAEQDSKPIDKSRGHLQAIQKSDSSHEKCDEVQKVATVVRPKILSEIPISKSSPSETTPAIIDGNSIGMVGDPISIQRKDIHPPEKTSQPSSGPSRASKPENSMVPYSLTTAKIDKFSPDNARYRPVGSVFKTRRVNQKSPITKIPNEIISNIIRFLIEDEINIGSCTNVYEEETRLQIRNLQLDSCRKINRLWRSLCQAELYRTVPLTSVRRLKQFATTLNLSQDVPNFVRQMKVSIPFTAVDGWTPPGTVCRTGRERAVAVTSAKTLSLIIGACPNLFSLDASFSGALLSISYMDKAHSALTHLSLDDCLPKKGDIKGLANAPKFFPNLEMLQLETGQEEPVLWKRVSINATDFMRQRLLLTSICFRDFPYVGDEFLKLALPHMPLLRSLHIERCSEVSSYGLAEALSCLNEPGLTSLIFIGSQSHKSEIDREPKDHHLCETLANKASLGLRYLVLDTVPVCEKLVSNVVWAKLESLVILGSVFQGCDVETTEYTLQKAISTTEFPSSEQTPIVQFGFSGAI